MEEEFLDISGEENEQQEPLSRRDILTPAIKHVIAALGGLEDAPSGNEKIYVLGDECYGCLKDLKRFWRKDDTDDERTVARIFHESGLLQNDLIPIILETTGKGDVENKCAIAAVDLMTGMTWPIDVAAELKELDEEEEESAVDYTTLITAHLHYKRALIGDKRILESIFDLVIPCMAKERWDRTERDKQIVTLILYLIRNLAFIRDLPLNTNLSADQAELSSLQSRYISVLHDTLILDFLLTFASNAIDDPLANAQNTLVLEIFYLLFRSIPPSSILPPSSNPSASKQSTATSNALRNALDAEYRGALQNKRHLTSRHSRFGTTIRLSSNNTGQSVILHRGAAVVQDKLAGDVLDRGKKKLAKRVKMRDELTGGAASAGGGLAGSGGETRLTLEVRGQLGLIAKGFIESCFNPFLSSLIKDIRAERAKVTEKDNLRLLFVTKFFMQFFLAMRERDIGSRPKPQKDAANGTIDPSHEKSEEEKMSLGFNLVLEVIQRGWAGWILRRMQEAMDMKPRQWTEIQAGLGCLTQLLLLVDAMAGSTDESLQDAAGTLQYQIYYNGEALERMLECMRSYKDQSFGYLEANIQLAYVLMRMLERWGSKNGGLYIRKSKKKKRKAVNGLVAEEEGIVDDASEDEQDRITDEILQEMTLEKFEHKFANEESTATVLTYLSHFQDFDSQEKMKWVVTLMHRQAVRAKAEGLYFKVSALSLFQTILSQQRMFPKDQPYKDLVNLITFLLRQFFKAVQLNPLVIPEAFFPKNRGMWKAFSSWEPPEKSKKGKEGRRGGNIDDSDDEGTNSLFPPDIRVKRGHTWSEQLGIAIGCLCEKDERHLIEWTKSLLRIIIGVKQLTINEVDKPADVDLDSDDDDNSDEERTKPKPGPSTAAMEKLEDFIIPYTEDGHATAATRNPHLKLLFTLIGFQIIDKNASELEWICPAKKLPDDLQRSLNLINQFLLDPIDLAGKKALQMISKVTSTKSKSKPSRRRGGDAFDELLDDSEDEGQTRRGAARGDKKKKEKKDTLSRQFIEDSDAEIGDDDAFFAAEAALRTRMQVAAENNTALQGIGTKKKRKKEVDGGEESEEGARKRPRKSIDGERTGTMRKPGKKGIAMFDEASDDEEEEGDRSESDSPLQRKSVASSPPTSRAATDDEDESPVKKVVPVRRAIGKSVGELDSDDEAPLRTAPGRQIKKLVLSDEEEE